MQISVSNFVSQVFGNAITPMRVNGQPDVGLQEERPPRWHSRKFLLEILLVSLGVAKQVHLDRLVAQRQSQDASHIIALICQFAYETMVGRQLEVAVKHKLPD